MSGYSDPVIVRHEIGDQDVLINRPVTRAELSRTLRRVLDAKQEERPGHAAIHDARTRDQPPSARSRPRRTARRTSHRAPITDALLTGDSAVNYGCDPDAAGCFGLAGGTIAIQ
jgi:hypothetical protein